MHFDGKRLTSYLNFCFGLYPVLLLCIPCAQVEEVADDDGEVDEEGVEPKDIELVMSQVTCTFAPHAKQHEQNR